MVWVDPRGDSPTKPSVSRGVFSRPKEVIAFATTHDDFSRRKGQGYTADGVIRPRALNKSIGCYRNTLNTVPSAAFRHCRSVNRICSRLCCWHRRISNARVGAGRGGLAAHLLREDVTRKMVDNLLPFLFYLFFSSCFVLVAIDSLSGEFFQSFYLGEYLSLCDHGWIRSRWGNGEHRLIRQ